MQILRDSLRRLLSFLFTANIEKYVQRYHEPKEEVEEVEYEERPMLAEYYDASATILIYFVYFVQIVGLIIIIVFLLTLPLDTQENIDGLLAIITCNFFILLGIVVIKQIQLYYMNKVTYYCKDCIIMRSYGHKDKVIRYADITEGVKKKKVRIHKGGIELPYKGGKLHICIHEDLFNDYIIRLINKKCGLKIPCLTNKEVKLIRKSGILPTYTKASFCIWVLDLAFMIIGSVIERSYNTFWGVYFPNTLEMFFKTHIIFILLGFPVLVIGIIAELLNFIPLRVHFWKHKIFKV